MALPASGQISLSQLRSEFGQSGTVSLNGFRKNPAYFAHTWDDNNQSNYGNRTGDPIGTITANSNIPNRGTTSAISLSNFHGATGYNDTVTFWCPATQNWTYFKTDYQGNGFSMCVYVNNAWSGGNRLGGGMTSAYTTPATAASDVDNTYHTWKGAYFVGSNAYRWSSGANQRTPIFMHDISLLYAYNNSPAQTSMDCALGVYAGDRSAGANYLNFGYMFNDCGDNDTGYANFPHFQHSNLNTVWGGGGSGFAAGSNFSHAMNGRTMYLSTTAGTKSVAFSSMTGSHQETGGSYNKSTLAQPGYYGSHHINSATDRRCFVIHRFLATMSGGFNFNANTNNTVQIA